ncbi:hypothetical protein tb265_44990 [Gemmatimonadetes bacterium T265]|nr:hypothetical protein tb265_44990 [Gemmatimonadetes bacterium T265]
MLLHELTHAWQAALPDDAFDALLAALAARDRASGFDAPTVEQATTSVAFGVAAKFTDQRAAAQLGARLLARARTVPADRPGALAARAAVLARLFVDPEWRAVRATLARGRGDARGRGWDAWLHALLLLEVQAYDAQRHCVTGGTADWGDSAPTLASGR